jgi:hypothetical protein
MKIDAQETHPCLLDFFFVNISPPHIRLRRDEIDRFLYPLSRLNLQTDFVQRGTGLSGNSAKDELHLQGDPRFLDLN